MIKRIRYIKSGGSIWKSNSTFNTNAGELYVKFDTHSKTAWLCSKDNDHPIETFESATMHKLKKEIKKKLSLLGVEFADEARVKRSTQGNA